MQARHCICHFLTIMTFQCIRVQSVIVRVINSLDTSLTPLKRYINIRIRYIYRAARLPSPSSSSSSPSLRDSRSQLYPPHGWNLFDHARLHVSSPIHPLIESSLLSCKRRTCRGWRFWTRRRRRRKIPNYFVAVEGLQARWGIRKAGQSCRLSRY